jgi:subtilisin family serine protease
MPSTVIDARSCLRSFGQEPAGNSHLSWQEEWETAEATGVSLGLIDGPFAQSHPDLAGADIVSKSFTSGRRVARSEEHGTHSVTTLVGHGNAQIRGIARRLRLCVAVVLSDDGVAAAQDVADAIEWLRSSRTDLIAITLADHDRHQAVARQVNLAVGEGRFVFAAAGNRHPQPIMFPAIESGVFAVGAADDQGKLTIRCCRFPRLDLIAPGTLVEMPAAAGSRPSCNGSSVASVLAAGTAALVLGGQFSGGKGARQRMLQALTGSHISANRR